MIVCPKCSKLTGFRRVLPFGTLVSVLLTTCSWLQGQKGDLPPRHSLDPQTHEDRCSQALHQQTGIPRAFENASGYGMQELVLVFSDGKIDVYINKGALDFVLGWTGTCFNGNFEGNLHFVYRDEGVRQQAIALLRKHYGPPRQSTCRQLAAKQPTPQHPIDGAVGGERWENVPCLVHTQTFDSFKYVVMDVTYFRTGMVGGSHGRVPGPLLKHGSSAYVAPLACIKAGEFEKKLDGGILETEQPGYETISTSWSTRVLADDTSFGEEVKTLGNPTVSGSVPVWDLLLGDLGPLEEQELGFPDILRVSLPQASFLHQVLEATSRKVNENWRVRHPEASNCAF